MTGGSRWPVGAGARLGGLVVPCPVLVGRAAELEVLAAGLEAAWEGRGAVAFVVGEAGIGKSRLVHELAALAARKGVRVLRGRAVPGSGGTAFRPLAEALAAAVADSDLGGGDLTHGGAAR
jgi:predicted ATPase